ncbi:3-keto-5-aminohexanoate cleavage protein [Methylobacterium sp. E-041]|uniref:3-keto-5-aminohexanoate cleavage protein n=1 Tax=unclassified Methylobacterium TaxID=2615210 RepID=UPI001FBBB6A2|nr:MULTISPECIES: 3-keto-5-aminohexanoate cleavage protein [unclassified Methylobacterium]MCJ2038960.1 3-keto-5-aminohexanoate cleavage protein [Methylobacterium sp. J-059]MCJ2106539.1 3-keto-5-aminohexanoate cleavage protein [Methylobacterium sp. E-041]
MSQKTVITCALTGSFDTPSKNPAVPVSPEAIARSALEAAEAGAAVVHVHVRHPETAAPSMELAHYREVVERIRERNADVILNLTTGAGGRFVPGASDPAAAGLGTLFETPAVRTRHVSALRPELCTLDVATMNFGENLFLNTPAHLRAMAEAIRAAGVRPEIEVFDLGHIALARHLIAEGHLAAPPLFQICLGIPWGAPADPETLVQMRARLPADAVWSAFGIGRAEFPMVALAASMGGNVRVGLEDNLYLARGRLAPSNAALVEKAVTLLSLIDCAPASPAEARAIFGLAARG